MLSEACEQCPLALSIKDLSFSYPVSLNESPVLESLNLDVKVGSFVLISGKTGSGKSTLLRLIKQEPQLEGKASGTIELFGRAQDSYSALDLSQLVGFVLQDPSTQIVCESVKNELAFGLENLELDSGEIRLRLAETCSFLGIEHLFRKKCAELSDGQRAIVCLASVLAMRPKLLLLDEPTALLDQGSSHTFISLLLKANKELGLTVVIATHDMSSLSAYADCVYCLEDGVLVKEDLSKLQGIVPRQNTLNSLETEFEAQAVASSVVSAEDLWFSYASDAPWILRGLDFEANSGEVHALLGSNGSGKTTFLKLMAQIYTPQRGRIRNSFKKNQAYLPSDPKAFLSAQNLLEELSSYCVKEEALSCLERLGLKERAHNHPYDLSRGQQQLLSFEKVMLCEPQLIILDEPSRGLDAHYKNSLAQRISAAAQQGATIIFATHDIEFVHLCAHRVSLLFDGTLALTEKTVSFFAQTWSLI